MPVNAKLAILSKIAVTTAALFWGAGAAHAECFNKAASERVIVDDKRAIFNAWEAVLQGLDWGAWAQWMASSQTLGQGPGWSVKNYQADCKAAGGGRECSVRATLCKP
jgi:hypothetical protein